MIDLHCHSHFSDGLLSPLELVQTAGAANVKLLALTDHDTIAGLASFREAAIDAGIVPVNGVEVSVRWKKHDIHVLGLNFDAESPAMLSLMERQTHRRTERARAIAEALSRQGVPDVWERVVALAGHERVGRPHFAALLVQDGLARDIQGAFRRFLGAGKSANVPTEWADFEECVSAVVESGGDAVLAHPLKYPLTRTKRQALVQDFVDAGGGGLEVVSGPITPSEMADMAGFCARFNLRASSGSDFHGHPYSRLNPGTQRELPVHCIPIWNQWDMAQGIT